MKPAGATKRLDVFLSEAEKNDFDRIATERRKRNPRMTNSDVIRKLIREAAERLP